VASLLEDEGYTAESLSETPDVVAEARRRRPDLLIVDLGRGSDQAYQVLDALRVDSSTRQIPVLALSTLEAVADAALASFNVRATLAMPLRLEDLTAKVRQALGEPPLYAQLAPDAPPPGALAQAERILAERSREALVRWVERLRQQPPWQDRSDVRLSGMFDEVPVLVEALAAALYSGDPAAFLARHPATLERLRAHTRLRRSQGVPLAALVREYAILRTEVWDLFRRYLPEEVRSADILALAEAVNGTLDRIIEVTIPVYGEALP
jgi:CheY-like chemotaxis protein